MVVDRWVMIYNKTIYVVPELGVRELCKQVRGLGPIEGYGGPRGYIEQVVIAIAHIEGHVPTTRQWCCL